MDQATTGRSRGFPIAQLIGIAMLGWALVPSNPYGYYVLLRIVVCGICAFLAFRAYEARLIGWAWTLGITAVICNPFARVHLNRPLWSAVNVVTIAMLAISIWVLRRRPKTTE